MTDQEKHRLLGEGSATDPFPDRINVVNRADSPSPEGASPKVVGWFDAADQTEPAFDPGLDVPCIVCWKPLTLYPRVTVSLMWANKRDRSYFIRAHKPCWESLTEGEQQRYEESVLP